MTILLTGANGQVGWEVLRQAREQGIPVVGLTRDELDITDCNSVDEKIASLKPVIVINAAAYTAVDKAEAERDQAFAVNGEAPGFLADACGRQGIPLVHISTDYVFDGSKGSPYDEDDPVKPLGVYGKSKLTGEQAVRNGLDEHIILRTSWVFGSHGGNFVKTVLRLAKAGGPLRIVDDQWGTPTSAQSIGDCLIALVNQYSRRRSLPWGIFHFAGGPDTSWYGFASEIVRQAREMGIIEGEVDVRPIPTSEFPTAAPRPVDSRLNGRRAREILGCSGAEWKKDLSQVLRRIAAER